MKSIVRLQSLFMMLTLLVACTGTPKAPPRAAGVNTRGAAATARAPATAPDTPVSNIAYADRLTPAPKMNLPRAAHSATLLADGQVLIAGGFRPEGTREIAIAAAEIYDPQSNTFTPTRDLNEARNGHTATLLPDGNVLLVGGWGPTSRRATAELYDPQRTEFRYTGSLLAPRAGMTATRLKDGRVLIVGGDTARNSFQAVAELYDPATGAFMPAGRLHTARAAHSATLLNDGRVLIAGGISTDNRALASAELFDPATGRFSLTGDLKRPRLKHAAVLLPDGSVLLIGGSNNNGWQGQFTSAEIYDVKTGTSADTANLNRARFKLSDAALLLDNGNVLVAGGNRQIEVFDTQTRQFMLSRELDRDYYFAVLTRLANGRVLITGGYDAGIRPTDRAWIYS